MIETRPFRVEGSMVVADQVSNLSRCSCFPVTPLRIRRPADTEEPSLFYGDGLRSRCVVSGLVGGAP